MPFLSSPCLSLFHKQISYYAGETTKSAKGREMEFSLWTCCGREVNWSSDSFPSCRPEIKEGTSWYVCHTASFRKRGWLYRREVYHMDWLWINKLKVNQSSLSSCLHSMAVPAWWLHPRVWLGIRRITCHFHADFNTRPSFGAAMASVNITWRGKPEPATIQFVQNLAHPFFRSHTDIAWISVFPWTKPSGYIFPNLSSFRYLDNNSDLWLPCFLYHTEGVPWIQQVIPIERWDHPHPLTTIEVSAQLG